MNFRLFFKSIVKFLFVVLAVFWILFEEIFWNNIERFTEWFARFRIIARLEEVIKRQSRGIALALFLIPVAIFSPFKFYATYLIAIGMVGKGMVIILLAKAAGTFFLTRLFILNKEKLLTFKYFSKIYYWVLALKQWAHDRLNSIATWVKIREKAKALKNKIKEVIVSLKNNGNSFWYVVLWKRYVAKIRKKKNVF